MKYRVMLMRPDDKPGDNKPVEKPADPPAPKPDDKPAEKQTLLGDAPPKPDDKPADPAPVEKKGLEKYDIKLPEKSLLEPAILERTAATARDLGLSDNAAAQKVVDFVNTEVASHVAAMTEAAQPGGSEWTKNVDAWEAAALADKEIGGTSEALKATATKAQRVLKTYFPPSVAQMLHNTGFGSHPDVLRALSKIAKAVGEDSLVQLEAPKTPEKKSTEDLFYAGSTSARKD